MLIHMLPWYWLQVFDQLTSFGNWDMSEHGICQTWVGSFQRYCMIWFDITLVFLPSTEIIHIIDRSCSILLGLGMRTSEAMLSQTEPKLTHSLHVRWVGNKYMFKFTETLECLWPEQNWKYRHEHDTYLLKRECIVFSELISPLF